MSKYARSARRLWLARRILADQSTTTRKRAAAINVLLWLSFRSRFNNISIAATEALTLTGVHVGTPAPNLASAHATS